MARYHYNFETGNVGVCKARNKCPLSNAPHFATMNEAMNYVEDIEKINQPTVKTVNKKILNNRSINREVKNFANNFIKDGQFILSNWYTPERIDKFEYLDKGAEFNVYLSHNKKFVYKIANNFENKDINEMYEVLINDQINYENIDQEFLKSNNCEYLETRFIELTDDYGGKNIIVVQPYLNESEYSSVSVNPFKNDGDELNEKGEELSNLGFDDLEEYNMKIRKNDGRIILFDCLAY